MCVKGFACRRVRQYSDITSSKFIKEARLRGSGSVMAANTDCKAEEGETETVPVNAVALGVVSNNALPKEYIHIFSESVSEYTRPGRYSGGRYARAVSGGASCSKTLPRSVSSSVCGVTTGPALEPPTTPPFERKRSWRAWAAWQSRAHVSAAASPVPRRVRTSPATTASPGPPVTSVGILTHCRSVRHSAATYAP